MTSIQLADAIVGYQPFAAAKILVTADEVYAAGTFAQSEICLDARLLEERGALVLTSGQSRYLGARIIVTEISDVGAAPLVLTCPGHNFQVGDTVIFASTALVDTNRGRIHRVAAVNGEEVTIDAYVPGSLSGTLGQTSVLYHALAAAGTLKEDMTLYNSGGARIGKVQRRTLAALDADALSVSTWPQVTAYTQEIGLDTVLEFMGLPVAGQYVRFAFYRKPLAEEALTETCNPILRSPEHDTVLYWGTIFYVLEMYHREPELAQVKQAAFALYRQMIQSVMHQAAMARHTTEMDYMGSRW
jgi:hypothetical protein